jgi:aryl-alcohol dehydrogenase-like predicted oxidoreductase
VSPVALGCWPIAGMTSLNVNDPDSLATIRACFDCGINFLDTAYVYGPHGQSERLIAQAVQGRRAELVIATKVGFHWDEKLVRQADARPATVRREFETSLRRLNTNHVELLYLHAPDGAIPIEQSAEELLKIKESGKARAIGISNATLAEIQAFDKVCSLSAVQPAYNMLQREIEQDILPWCRERQISVIVYWPLMKGLLAGKLPRNYVFDPKDGRAKYPMFQGAEWQKNQDLVDKLRTIADSAGKTLAQLVVNWTIHQPGITVALCGAKRPDQILETAGAMGWRLTDEQNRQIEEALAARGKAITRGAV